MDKTQNLLEKFLETVEMTGTCGFWVEKEINAKRMRMWLANEVNKFLGLDVDVRSTAEKCS
jgi:hypothetical protein